KLLILEKLNKRRPDIYTTTESQICQNKVKEIQAHLASCKEQTSLWKRIQKQFASTVVKTACDTFYEQKKDSNKKKKANQQEIKERKKKTKEKENRIEKEDRKTMLELVVE
ncbi:8496_t:CDS:2, partial [Racocetra persica]